MGLVADEVRLHRRHAVLPGLAALTVTWAVVLRAVPAAPRSELVPWVLFLDLATLGFLVAPALTVVERGNGVTAAHRLTRLRPVTALAVRVGVLAATAILAAGVVVVAGGAAWPRHLVAGVTLTSVLLSLLAVVMVGRGETLTGYLSRVPAVAVPLLVPALVRGLDVSDHPALALSPATGALQLLRGEADLASVAWACVCAVALAVAAVRIGFDVEPTTASSGGPRRHHAGSAGAWPTTAPGRWAAIRAFARADLRALRHDPLLLLLVASVPLLGGALRWLLGPGTPWIAERFGVEVGPWLPVAWAFVLVLHVPVSFGMVGGLLLLEDRDAGVLPGIAVTPAGLETLVRYRLATTALGGAAAAGCGLLLAGADHRAGAIGVLATAVVAGAVAVLPAVLLPSLARDRVQGVAVSKAVGLPLYLPIAWWLVAEPVGWLFALSPTGWAVRTAWATSPAAATAWALGGVAFVAAVVCSRRTPALAACAGRLVAA